MVRGHERHVGCDYAYVEAELAVRPLALAMGAGLASDTAVGHGSPAIAAVAGAGVGVSAVSARFAELEDCSWASVVGLAALAPAVVVFEVSGLAGLVAVALAPELELELEACQHLSISEGIY